MSETKGQRLVRMLDAMKPARQLHEDTWRDCFDMTFPIRAGGLSGANQESSTMRDRRGALLDSTGADSARILASALMGGLTPANSRWFALDVGNESDEERRWLDEAAESLWENIHRANFDAEAFEACIDSVVAGWFCLYIDEDPEGGLRFEHWPLAECYAGASKPGGTVDTLYRLFTLTAEQLVAEYGSETVGEEIRQQVQEGKYHEPHEVAIAIYPRTGAPDGGRLARDMPIESCHVLTKTKTILRESGYHEFPVICPRWARIPKSVYAVGPVYDALPDLLELNALLAMEKAALDLAVAGMWIAVDDGILNPKTVKVGPRKVVVAADVDSMKPLLTGADFKVSFTAKEQLQAQIRKVLMSDQLQPVDGPQMTATEVHMRAALIRQQLGPIFGRFQAEYLSRLIDRTFGLAFRAGVFAPPPESLQGRVFQVRYLSPLARSQKLEEVTAMDRYETTLIQEAQLKPEIVDVYKWDDAAKKRGELLGVPLKLIATDDEIAQAREARVKAQQQAEQQAQQQMMTQEAAKAAMTR